MTEETSILDLHQKFVLTTDFKCCCSPLEFNIRDEDDQLIMNVDCKIACCGPHSTTVSSLSGEELFSFSLNMNWFKNYRTNIVSGSTGQLTGKVKRLGCSLFNSVAYEVSDAEGILLYKINSEPCCSSCDYEKKYKIHSMKEETAIGEVIMNVFKKWSLPRTHINLYQPVIPEHKSLVLAAAYFMISAN